jgi:hypothetical protein
MVNENGAGLVGTGLTAMRASIEARIRTDFEVRPQGTTGWRSS